MSAHRRLFGVNNAGEHVQTYFEAVRLTMKSCTAEEDSYSMDHELYPNQHISLHKPQPISTFYPPSTFFDILDGELSGYLRHIVSISPYDRTPNDTPCWRSIDGEDTCGGTNFTYQFLLSMPVMLVIGFDPDTPDWNIPLTLCSWSLEDASAEHRDLPLDNKKPDASPPTIQNISYDLVARAFGNGGHFNARLLSETGGVLLYDDMAHNGRAVEIPEALPHTHLAGRDQSIALRPGFSTRFAIYQLRGGLQAQQLIQSHQTARLRSQYQMDFQQVTTTALPVVQFSLDSGLRQMPVESWWWRKNRSGVTWQEYIVEGSMHQPRVVQRNRRRLPDTDLTMDDEVSVRLYLSTIKQRLTVL